MKRKLRVLIVTITGLTCLGVLSACGQSGEPVAATQPSSAPGNVLAPYDSQDELTPAERRQIWITKPSSETAASAASTANTRVSQSAVTPDGPSRE